MRQFSGACRFVYNKTLAFQKENHEAGKKFVGKFAISKLLTEWRNSADTPWLADAPRHALMMATQDLDRAFGNFFAKRADFPRFKRKGERVSFQFPDKNQIVVDNGNGRIKVPKLGYLRYRKSRDVVGEVRSVTVSLCAGKWFVSILTKREIDQPIPKTTTAIGIDVGIARFATMNDGSFLAPVSIFKKHEQRLKRYQRAMSRKQKFSANWKKAKAKVTRYHAKIGNIRKDFLHKATHTISQNHALVCIEDLQVRNMSKSAKGTAEQHGKCVKQKSGLNKAILDQGWGEFRRQLEYKTDWNGGMLIAVPPQNTSRECPICGHISKDNRKTQAEFQCVECSYENHADVVGAINILARGHRVLACGEARQSAPSAKQEPTEATHCGTLQ